MSLFTRDDCCLKTPDLSRPNDHSPQQLRFLPLPIDTSSDRQLIKIISLLYSWIERYCANGRVMHNMILIKCECNHIFKDSLCSLLLIVIKEICFISSNPVPAAKNQIKDLNRELLVKFCFVF